MPSLPQPLVQSGGPVRQRELLPDMLRGVALLGILLVNMQDFAGFQEWQQQGPDRAAQIFTDIFANGRFISIFAMLFGWGAAGLLARHGAGLLLRRHGVLLLVGTLHFVLVWHGDIISLYAVLGLGLVLLRNLGAGALVGVAVLSGGWWLVSTTLEALQALARADLPRFSGLPELIGHSYGQVVAIRATDFVGDLLGGAIYNGPWLLALFCLGAAAAQVGLLERPQQHQPLLRRLLWWGGSLGLGLGLALAWLNTRTDYGSGLLAIPCRMGGGLAGGLSYVGLLGLLAARKRLGRWAVFAQSGRIAMSNYLAQSLVMTTVFYPYAGAQWGKWGAASTLGLGLCFGLLQVALSDAVVRQYGSGPLEKAVRWLVYSSPALTSDASSFKKDKKEASERQGQ